jgi:RNA polymerase sigma-70 factor (ECF subfamily)
MGDETSIRAASDVGDFRRATHATLEAYGTEIFTLLSSMHAISADAEDAFSAFAERLFLTMPRFRWDCSMRTWAYRLGRNASRDVRRASKAGRNQPITDASISALVVRLRTATASYLADEKKHAFARLREELPEDDRELLVLRVNRGMEWLDIARIFVEDDAPGEEPLKREASRLRKRFQLVKDRLRAEGRARGLIEES